MTPLARLIAPLRRRVQLMVGRGVVRLVNDSLKLQGLQVSLLAGETHDDVERFQEYGFTSHPHPGAEAVLVFAGGIRSHGLCVGVGDRRYRLKALAAGEVALYDDLGSKIHLQRGGIIELTTSARVVVNAPLVEVPNGDVKAGNINLKTHKHSHTATGAAESLSGGPVPVP